MKLKQRASDFRVRELLREGVLAARGEFRVYRVIKRKLTSLEAAEILAAEAGRGAGEVSMCGLKDRQGVTTQYMALARGPEVAISAPDLRVEAIGFTGSALDSKDSDGNAFEIVARGLDREDIAAMRANLATVRKQGLINYFDDQRFGNLRHGQGWIALDLMRGEVEKALKKLVAARSLHDVPRVKTLKQALWDNWGDWGTCREIAGKLGVHHSVFEALKRDPQDFAGAFYHVSSRVRLIHLYAYQSHVWNRSVATYVRQFVKPAERVVLETEEGPLVYPDDRAKLPGVDAAVFRLPGPGLEDVADKEQRALLADVLAADRLVPAQFRIDGISGFQLKGEDRPLFVVPAHLRVRPPKDDPLHPGCAMLGVRFELPRGAYATLVVRRLMERPGREAAAQPTWERGERERSPLRHDRIAQGYERRGPPDVYEPRRDERARAPRDERRGGSRGAGPASGRGARRDDRGFSERRPPSGSERFDRGRDDAPRRYGPLQTGGQREGRGDFRRPDARPGSYRPRKDGGRGAGPRRGDSAPRERAPDGRGVAEHEE
ncbi:MAG: tRNA pseudouridine(13) synthase TruD [Planctomycetes bacterium]|nr:tRNA pseudouridine(13) synthase TruD [Planctomycetota bacterium]